MLAVNIKVHVALHSKYPFEYTSESKLKKP